MTWRPIARMDLRTIGRSRGTVALVGVFVLAYVGLAGLLLYVDEPSFEVYTNVLAEVLPLVVPLVAVLVGYDAVVGERTTGTAALALSLPHSRGALVTGKLAARVGLLTAALWVATLLGGALTGATFPAFDAATLVGLSALVTVQGGLFLGLAVGVSMLLRSTRRVIAAALGSYFALVVAWSTLINAVGLVLFRFQSTVYFTEYPAWAAFVRMCAPAAATEYLLAEVVGVGSPPEVTQLSDAWFVSSEGAAFGLVVWAILPLAAGFARFARHDL